MSFQQVRSEIDICNKALARIFQQPLSGSLSDPANQNKLAARECNRFYKAVVRSLLEKHHWGIATKRVALTAIANTRAAEWAEAYARPSDMAFPVSISPYVGASQVSYYAGLGFLLGTLSGMPVFRYENSTIFARIAGAELDYVSFDITEADFTQTFEDLVVEFLAAKLANPVAKDPALAADIENVAVSKMNQAIAHNLNAMGQRYDHYITEGEMARGGMTGNLLMGWRT